MEKKIKISVRSESGRNAPNTIVDISTKEELIEFFAKEGIATVAIKSYPPFDDDVYILKSDIKCSEFSQEDFERVADKIPGSFEFIEIETRVPPPPKDLLHPKHLPFEAKEIQEFFRHHDDPAKDNSAKFIEYFQKSIGNYNMYHENKAEEYKTRTNRQLEKDERFWTTKYFSKLFLMDPVVRNEKLKQILTLAFGDKPPLAIATDWDTLINTNLKLKFEKDFRAPSEYKTFLSKNLKDRHFIPYILDWGASGKPDAEHRSNLEGPTQVDACIEGKDNFKIFIEAKVLSDISYEVTYDVYRNQLARNIDIMLEHAREKGLFLLLTPKRFKDNPTSRLYGYKMHDYQSNHLNIMADLSHRKGIEPQEWKQIAGRIAWITWEDLNDLGFGK